MDRKLSSTRGFTLAELLIVVAIIAVLVAIAIPVFNSQLEKSREATDIANVRSAYAEVMTAAITEDKTATCNGTVMCDSKTDRYIAVVSPLAQKQPKWQTSTPITIGSVSSGADGGSNGLGTWNGEPQPGGSCTIICGRDGAVIFNWRDGGSPSAPDGPSTPGDANASFTDVPSKLESGQTFLITEGNIYKYGDRYFIAGTTTSFNEYYFPAPGTAGSEYAFIPIRNDVRIITKPDQDNIVLNVNAGDVYKADDGYYIIKVGASHQNIPPGTNWVKINYTVK